MNRFQHQDAVIRERQAARAAQVRVLTDAERDRQATQLAAERWIRRQPEFSRLVCERGHVCQWLIVAALELKRRGGGVSVGAVLALRDGLIPVGQAACWAVEGGGS